jgi:polysaccharide biosynthesis protein PslH
MRILFTTPILEYPAAGGPQIRIQNSIKALSQVSDLTIVWRVNGLQEADDRTRVFFRSYCSDLFVVPSLLGRFRRGSLLRKAVRAMTLLVPFDSALEAIRILNIAKINRSDVIWLGFGNISFGLILCLRLFSPSLKMVCDTDSVWSRFVLRELPFAKGFRWWSILVRGYMKALQERIWVALCQVTTAVSDVDASYYRRLTQQPHKVQIFSNVIHLGHYELKDVQATKVQGPAVLLAGSFGAPTSSMNLATRWVLESVWPLVKEKLPDVHLLIVGRNSDLEFKVLEGPRLTVSGTVESVLPYLKAAQVAIVPLKFESGTRFKILEAGACYLPVVSTTLGAEGIPVQEGKDVLLADTEEDFAAAIIRVLKDETLARSLGLGCRALVAKAYSVEALVGEANQILNRVCGVDANHKTM